MSSVKLEYQAKDQLARVGIPTPTGLLVRTPAQAAQAAERIGGTVMIKAQVARSHRFESGGIQIAEGPAETQRLAHEMLGREIQGAVVQTLLVEEQLISEAELYVGAVYDPLLGRPVLVASNAGGTGVESSGKSFREPFSVISGCPIHVARVLGTKLGLSGQLLLNFAEVAQRLAQTFLELDATLFEINPLLVVGDRVIAVDAHLAIDPEVPLVGAEDPESARDSQTEVERAAAEIDASDHRGVAGRLVEFGGSIGLLIGGGGASLTVFDAVMKRGLKPFNYGEIGGNPTAEKIAKLTTLLLAQPQVEHLAVVMNVVNNTRADLVAEGVISGVLEAGRVPADVISVFRVPGHDESRCREILEAHQVKYLDQTVSLEGAVDYLYEKECERTTS
jgi:succinyl-CoA synthetase beta subunit